MTQEAGSNAGGFSFDLVKRNAMLAAKGVPAPRAWKTGTTIAGVVFKVCAGSCRVKEALHARSSTCRAAPGSAPTPSSSLPRGLGCCAHAQDGVVLAADTRSTSGSTVADKNCEKIHYIAPNIYCCGAGTAADTENVTGELRAAAAGCARAAASIASRALTPQAAGTCTLLSLPAAAKP
jgi:20S proteasome subunit beta 2